MSIVYTIVYRDANRVLRCNNLRSNVIYRSRLRFLPRSLFRSPYRENRRTIDRESDRMQIRNCEGKREREKERKRREGRKKESYSLYSYRIIDSFIDDTTDVRVREISRRDVFAALKQRSM